MAYIRGIGDGEDPGALIFNSTKYPGVCKPSDSFTLGAFKGLQAQLNRLAQLKGQAKIAVDGDIGPGTVRLASAVGIDSSGSCSIIAQNALVYTSIARGIADAGGAPMSVSAPAPTKPPTIVNAAGVELPAPSTGIAASVSNLWSGLTPVGKIAGLTILGGIGYLLWKDAR